MTPSTTLEFYIMASSDVIEVEGKVVQVLPGTMFRVQLANAHTVLGHISGKLRKNFIKITVGDVVKMEMTPTDLEKARIIYRVRTPSANPSHGHRRR
jgi:translation initiation factor IF-1